MTDFIHFYCINLNRNKGRWNTFINQPAINDIKRYPFERVEAVDGKTLDINNDYRISLRAKRDIKEGTRRSHEDIVSVGAIGCYLSHVDTWKKIIDNKEPYAVVFEDDVMLPNNFMQLLLEGISDMDYLSNTPDLWTFSYGWPSYYSTKGLIPPQDIAENNIGSWIINTHPGGTCGYLITRKGAEKLLRHAFPIDVQVDFYMCICIELNHITCVANRALILDAFNNVSNIQQISPCLICDVPTNLYPHIVGLLIVSAGLIFISYKISHV